MFKNYKDTVCRFGRKLLFFACIAITAFYTAAAEVREFSIELPENAPANMRLAARELSYYAGKITGRDLPFNGTGKKIVLRQDPSQKELLYDGYRIVTEKNGNLLITGRSAKGVEYGTYALMEALGVRFYLPGPGGTYIPPRDAGKAMPALNVTSSPRLRPIALRETPNTADILPRPSGTPSTSEGEFLGDKPVPGVRE